MFIDSAKIFAKAGNGGNGCVSLHREKYVAKGGPDGGDGGRGGDVVFVVDEGLRTLIDFKYKRKYVADNGKNGSPSNSSGKSGEDLVIKVPPGTIIKDELTGCLIADLTENEQRFVLAKGGKGGAGNQHFATPTRQLPTFAKPGALGREFNIVLELKLLADVGLVGFPNAGKSTLLSIVSKAKPKIADYPFTTLTPNLGVVSIMPGESFVIADIPGIIEGAHEGVGLGHDFLKHIERTRIIIHVVDIAGVDGRDPVSDFEIINRELAEYSKILAQRPQIVAANKIDITGCEENLEKFKEAVGNMGYEVYEISAGTNSGIMDLMKKVATKLKDIPYDSSQFDIESDTMYKVAEDEKQFTIRKEGSNYYIDGDWIRKLVNSIDFSSTDSLQYFQRVIKKSGISDELEKMGIDEGDTVIADGFEFDYVV